MRTQSICLALVIVLGCPVAAAQWVQTNGLNDRQVPHRPLIGTNVFQEPQRLSGVPTKNRVHADLIGLLDSLRTSGAQLPLPAGKFLPNDIERSPRSLRMTSSPQSDIYVIDTAIVKSTYHETTKHLYTFNPEAKKTSDLTQKLAGDNWVDASRETNTYDESSNMLTDLYQIWRDGHWVITQSNTYTYDANGNLLSLFNEPFVSMGDCADGARWTYTYDTNGNLVSDLWQILWDSTSLWEDAYCDKYTYDVNNNMVTSLRRYWSNGQWLNWWCGIYTYDASNNMVTSLTANWSNGQWVNSYRQSFTYDASNILLSHLYEGWSNNQWVNSDRDTYTYDANGNMLSSLGEQWSNGQWLNFGRETYTYDSSNELLSYLYKEWSVGQWMNHSKKTYNYDAQGNLGSFWNYTWRNASWTPADIGGRGYGLIVTDIAGNSYGYIGYNFEFSHRLIVTGVAPHNVNLPANYSLLQNYPNPFNPSTTIKYELPKASQVNLSVFDILGREVSVLVNERRDAGVYDVKFDGSRLSSGVYFYRIQAGDYIASRKMLVLK